MTRAPTGASPEGPTRATARLAAALACAIAATGCVVASPSAPDAGSPTFRDAPARDVPSGRPDAPPPPTCDDPGGTLGDVCDADARCDDHCFCNGRELCTGGRCAAGAPACAPVACATATCAEATRCTFVADDALCDDGDPCNGTERCDTAMGCRASAPPTCNDADICTIDACEPGTGCVFSPYDGDGDGATSRSCGGADCDDTSAAIGPGALEACTNGRDDDCDGAIDVLDTDCVGTNDTCATAEDVTPAGLGTVRYRRATTGFTSHATLDCTTSTLDTRRGAPDAVFALHLSEMRDVTVAVEGLGYNAGLILRDSAACTTGPNLKCIAPSSSTVEPVMHRRRLPPGDYSIFVVTRAATVFTLAVTLEAPSASQSDVCAEGTPDASAGGSFAGALEDDDYDLSCHVASSAYPEAAHVLVIPPGEVRDVRLTATARTPTGSVTTPYVELTAACGTTSVALGCDAGTSSAPAELVLRGVPAGTYYVLVESASSTAGIGSYTLTAEVTAAVGTSPGDTCAAGVPVTVTEGTPAMLDLALLSASPDVGEFCAANRPGYRDAFFAFSLAAERDVLVRTTSTARHWAGASGVCGSVASLLDCAASSGGVAERRFVRMAPGTHFIDVSTLATSGLLTAEIITYPPTPAPANDVCSGAVALLDGTPSDADLAAYDDDQSLACSTPGALDAYYTFTLTTQRFVTLRAEGARAMALLRDSCATAPMACASGAPPQIAQILDPGTYLVAIESPPLEAGAVRVRFTTADP